MIHIKSAHSVSITADKLESAPLKKKITVFNRIDHATGAKKVGKSLRTTELIIFGNPNIGTVLMQCTQSVAIDLPQKMLIWEDSSGDAWLSYNHPRYLAERHKMNNCREPLRKVAGALKSFAVLVTRP
jgi:uncharacterized protein (DUF302 family)